MDGEERKTDDSVTPSVAALLAQPRRVGFYRAVELLERATPNAVRIGDVGPAGREAIRFRHDPSLAFSASDVTLFAMSVATMLKSRIRLLSTAPEAIFTVLTWPSAIIAVVTAPPTTLSATLARRAKAPLTICWRGAISKSAAAVPSSTVTPR